MYKNRLNKFISAAAVLLILAFSFSGCSALYSATSVIITPDATSDVLIDVIGDESEAIGKVTVTIVYPEEAKLENSEGSISIYKAQGTVLDSLSNYCWANGIDIAVETSGTYSYVTSINGISENDYGNVSGWVYTINGEEVMEAADVHELRDGDSVEWKYVDFSS